MYCFKNITMNWNQNTIRRCLIISLNMHIFTLNFQLKNCLITALNI